MALMAGPDAAVTARLPRTWAHLRRAFAGRQAGGFAVVGVVKVVTLWTAIVTSGLTSPQFAVLALLANGEELDQRTIAEGAALDKSTCGELVDRLARRGLVAAGPDPDDRRRKLIRITDEGLQRLAAAASQQREVHAAALAGLSETEAGPS